MLNSFKWRAFLLTGIELSGSLWKKMVGLGWQHGFAAGIHICAFFDVVHFADVH
jgi:hypothetical protein